MQKLQEIKLLRDKTCSRRKADHYGKSLQEHLEASNNAKAFDLMT